MVTPERLIPDPGLEEFNITVEADGRVRAEWQHGRVSDAEGALDIQPLKRRAIDALAGLLRDNKLRRHDELTVLGDLLFTTLFGLPKDGSYRDVGGPGGLLYRALNDSPEEENERLFRVSLEIDPANGSLVSWPWEYLHIPHDLKQQPGRYVDIFIGEHADFVLTRRLSKGLPPQTSQVSPPVRVLFVASSPEKGDPPLAPVQYHSVLEDLRKLYKLGLTEPANPDRIDLQTLTPDYDLDGQPYSNEADRIPTDFGTFMHLVGAWKPHVVHIVAHGRHRYDPEQGHTVGEIAFRDHRNGTPLWIGERKIADCLSSPRTTRLVFLQACESGGSGVNSYHGVSGMAHTVAGKEIPAVVAMQFQVQNARANEFARVFYERLMKRDRIELAMHEGVRELAAMSFLASERPDFGIPVLYLRGDTPLLAPIGPSARKPLNTGARDMPRIEHESTEGPPEPYADYRQKPTLSEVVDRVNADRTGYSTGGMQK